MEHSQETEILRGRRSISRCVMCGSPILGGNTDTLNVHRVCAAWWYQQTNTIARGRVKERTYTQKTLADQMFHTELVEAIGSMVQKLGARQVSRDLDCSEQQLHGMLTLQRSVPQTTTRLLGFRRVPIYISEGSVKWPLDLVQKSGNLRRML